MDTWDNPRASLKGVIESIPADDASFDVVLCAQVLEHVDDPAQGVRELARVTRPGGRVLLSTHGAMVYHPNPVDLWRWTGAGLERLFTVNGDWASVTVSAGSGRSSSILATSMTASSGKFSMKPRTWACSSARSRSPCSCSGWAPP